MIVESDAARATDDATVRLSPRSRDDGTFPSRYDAVDALEPGMVLRVRVSGFAEFAEGIAAQCVHRAKASECGNSFPVQFDGDGTAFFQYQLRDDSHALAVAGGRCHPGATRCTLVVRDEQRNDHRA